MGRLALRAILTPGTGAAAIRSGPFRVRVTKGKKGPVLRAALSGGSSSQGRCAYLQLPVGRAGGYRAAPLVAQGRLRQARGRVAARNTTPPSTGVYGARELQGSGSWRRWFARFRRGLRV